ncbi:MAG TPA: flavodoxin domain-containing protein [Actinomycetota bacterium]|jgi:menaquinone-dependent protoporphyrinogen oxidase|nr:flavodoxin domain-containing protein [Actinomycetota bacterium]
MPVLVTYASKHGATEGIAEAIGERLRERGIKTEVEPIGDRDDLGAVDAVVVGSAIYMGSWMKEASAFLERHRDELDTLPVWLFSSGPTGEGPTEVGLADKQLAKLAGLVAAREHHVFFGAIDPERLGFLERRIVKTVKAPTGDFRDWDEVRSFADRIAGGLS